MKPNYFQLFDTLKSLDVYPFKSYISSSQYLLAYQLILDYTTTSSTILDWGTGSGHFSFFLLEQGFNVTAFSIEKQCQLSDYLKSKFPNQYQFISDPNAIKKLPFKTDSFDIITSIGVLEHVREFKGQENDSLLEIYRILKPGGTFICYHLPNKFSWVEFLTPFLKKKYNHTYKYSRQDIKEMLNKANFYLFKTKRYGIFPRLTFRSLITSFLFANIFNQLDKYLSILFSIICQNHYFVAKKSP
mgnify:CR=1 FL=1|tara:strand:- start:4257 stop:4988 length:732 start_codon:yes stop_codon:yes gene_type:complete